MKNKFIMLASLMVLSLSALGQDRDSGNICCDTVPERYVTALAIGLECCVKNKTFNQRLAVKDSMYKISEAQRSNEKRNALMKLDAKDEEIKRKDKVISNQGSSIQVLIATNVAGWAIAIYKLFTP